MFSILKLFLHILFCVISVVLVVVGIWLLTSMFGTGHMGIGLAMIVLGLAIFYIDSVSYDG